jgi:hypothetical protein
MRPELLLHQRFVQGLVPLSRHAGDGLSPNADAGSSFRAASPRCEKRSNVLLSGLAALGLFSGGQSVIPARGRSPRAGTQGRKFRTIRFCPWVPDIRLRRIPG